MTERLASPVALNDGKKNMANLKAVLQQINSVGLGQDTGS
jgi:hypothetical protein